MKIFKKIKTAFVNVVKEISFYVVTPFECIWIALEESREMNEDGSWDKYWERKNRKAAQKEQKIAKKRRTGLES